MRREYRALRTAQKCASCPRLFFPRNAHGHAAVNCAECGRLWNERQAARAAPREAKGAEA